MYKKYLIILGISLYFSLKTIQVHAADYEYDDLGRVTRTVYEDGSSVTYTYDANGNIVEIKVDEEDHADDEDNADNSDENKDDENNISEEPGDIFTSGEEQTDGKSPSGKTGMANDSEDEQTEQVTDAKKADRGLGSETDQEGARQEEYEKDGADRAIADGEILGETESIAENEEKAGKVSDEIDDENTKENVKGKSKYLAAVCVISGVTAAVFFKSRQRRSSKKHDAEGKMTENGEKDHES